MKRKKYWEIGGFLAGALLIVFGVAAVFMGVNGYNTTRDSIKGEGITFGPADDPAVAKYADQWAGQQVTNGRSGTGIREGHAHAHARGHGRPQLCVDGPLPVGCEANRPGGHERRDRSGQGRHRSARSPTAPGTSG